MMRSQRKYAVFTHNSPLTNRNAISVVRYVYNFNFIIDKAGVEWYCLYR